MIFHDDLIRLRTGYGPANIAIICRAALNLIRIIPDRARPKVTHGTTNTSSAQ